MLAFFDTNVLACCTDTAAPAKLARARRLVAERAAAGEAVVSTQVLIELFNTPTRKQQMPPATAQALTEAYAEWPVIDSNVALVRAAIGQSIRHRLSIWDAMVVEAALRAGADVLYSEDLGHEQRFGALSVVNPFVG